jgi:hypothetical protein
LSRRSLWFDDMAERGEIIINNTRIVVENLYREFGCYNKSHEEAGCPKCKLKLFDRLTIAKIYESNNEPKLKVHLNSGENIEELKKLKVQEVNGINLYFKNGNLVAE